MDRYSAVFALVLAGMFLSAPVFAEPLPCESEYIPADRARFALMTSGLTAAQKSEYQAQLDVAQPKLDACYDDYRSKSGEAAYQDLVHKLGG